MKKSDPGLPVEAAAVSVQGPGIAATILSMIIWGLAPLYWSELNGIPALELILHRVVWVWLVLLPVVFWRGKGRAFLAALRTAREGGLHLLSGVLLAINWFSFVWAVLNERVVEVSLGYFILPLLNVLLGFIFFRERLSRLQGLAVSLAALAVVIELVQYGELPWTALLVALSFGFYSLIRKKSVLGSLTGLAVEMTFLFPLAFGVLLFRLMDGSGAFGPSPAGINLLLAGTGLLTATPLLLFAFGARRIPLSTVGVMQYIAPSLHFLLGVFIYREPFSPGQGMTFGLIWFALALYSIDLRLKYRAARLRSHGRV